MNTILIWLSAIYASLYEFGSKISWFVGSVAPKPSMFGDKKGQVSVVGLIISIVSLIILILVGVLIIDQVDDVAGDLNLSASANSTYESILSTVWSTMPLLSIAPLVLVATFILGLLIWHKT